MKHTVKSGFHTHPVRINLIGVGGGGSLVLSGLVRLHLAMKSLGHPYGLDVEVWDPDRVSSANIGRQLFCRIGNRAEQSGSAREPLQPRIRLELESASGALSQ